MFHLLRCKNHKVWQTVQKLRKLQSNLGSGDVREIMGVIEAGLFGSLACIFCNPPSKSPFEKKQRACWEVGWGNGKAIAAKANVCG